MPLPNGYIKYRMGGLAPLYKGSNRMPLEVFTKGWSKKNGLVDIKNHLLNKGKNSCWWSTSLDKFAAADFGRYVYMLHGLNDSAIVANEAYCIINKKQLNQIPFIGQCEMSVYEVIPPENVAGVFDKTIGYTYQANLNAHIIQNVATW